MIPKLQLGSPTFATHYLRMLAFGTEKTMSTGTGFIYEYEDYLYLITNGHNVTRLNPQQDRRIIDSAAFPSLISTKTRFINPTNPDLIGITEPFVIDLYEDDEFKKPTWYIHPVKGYLIDVVAIPIGSCEKIPKNIKFFPINKFNFDTEYPPEVSDDVFILGYPFNITGKLELPVWKRGTIASEPAVPIDDLPKMFVDTATRSGMSGSPVIMKRTGIHGFDGKQRTGKEIIGTIYNFIGIYSGRIGADDEFQAQLGVVWSEEVILEILKAKKKSDIKFQMI
jgi:hypothetical protein